MHAARQESRRYAAANYSESMNISLFGRTPLYTNSWCYRLEAGEVATIHPFDLLWAALQQLEVANPARRPAGSPTSGTSALEKNNSGILFIRQTGSSKICTEPMGRRMACNSAPRASTSDDDPAGSIDRSGHAPAPLSHCCSLVQCVEQFVAS
jgi:hypothetical protein